MKVFEQSLSSLEPDHRDVTGRAEESPIQKLVSQVLIAKAATLARAGRYGSALQALSELSPDETTSAPALDLRARILAQQGRLSEAEALWKQVLRVDPLNTGYEAALRRIAALQRQRVTGLRIFMWGGVLIVVLLLFWFALVQSVNREAPSAADTVRLIEGQQALKAEIAQLRTAIAGIPNIDERTAASPDIPNFNIQLPGVRSSVESNAVVLSFEEGLFYWGNVLKPDAVALLTELGHELQPYSDEIAVQVVGHTDDVPMQEDRLYIDNVALGLDRARVVADHLRMTTKLSAGALTISSFGSHQTPFPNNTPDNRERNRTVTIHITINDQSKYSSGS